MSETTRGPAIIEARPGSRTLKVFGVTVQGTTKEHLWPALDRLAEAINIAAEQHERSLDPPLLESDTQA